MVQGQNDRSSTLKLLIHRHPYLAAVLLGAIQAIASSFALGDQNSALIQLLGYALFILVIEHQTAASVFQITWLFTTTWLVGSVAWLYVALHVHGHMNAVISIAAILLLCAGLATYYSGGMWLMMKIKPHSSWALTSGVLAATWTMAELARAQWFTGFPWAAIGYSHVQSYLSYAAPYIGVYGVGFIAVFLATLIANTWMYGNKITQFGALLVILSMLVPTLRDQQQSDRKIEFSLLQANIPQDLKFANARNEALNWYKEELINSKADITVLPETAIPYFKEDLPSEYWNSIEQQFQGQAKAAIIGIPTRNVGQGYGNSAWALGMTHGPSAYHKYHLVPFGEFTPSSLKWFNEWVDLGLTDFIRGSDEPEPFTWQTSQLSVNICYEDLFGEDLAKRFVMGDDKAPDILINLSNLGWFGDNYVVNQHLNIARMRSLEFARPTVRATNSGGTAIINAQGEIESLLKPYTRGVLLGKVNAETKGITPYAYWAGHWGLKPLWLVCLGIWGIAFWQYKRQRLNEKTPSVH